MLLLASIAGTGGAGRKRKRMPDYLTEKARPTCIGHADTGTACGYLCSHGNGCILGYRHLTLDLTTLLIAHLWAGTQLQVNIMGVVKLAWVKAIYDAGVNIGCLGHPGGVFL